MRGEIGGMRGEMRAGFSEVTERLERLEVATVGVGRVSALEDRVRRLEERIGTDPER